MGTGTVPMAMVITTARIIAITVHPSFTAAPPTAITAVITAAPTTHIIGAAGGEGGAAPDPAFWRKSSLTKAQCFGPIMT